MTQYEEAWLIDKIREQASEIERLRHELKAAREALAERKHLVLEAETYNANDS